MLARHVQLLKLQLERDYVGVNTYVRTIPARHMLLPPPAASATAPISSNTPQPSKIRRCQDCGSVVRLLYKHHSGVSPRFWVTALCHLSELVCSRGQQVPLHSWKQLQECLQYLTEEADQPHQPFQQPQEPLQGSSDATQQTYGEIGTVDQKQQQQVQPAAGQEGATEDNQAVQEQLQLQHHVDLLHHHQQADSGYSHEQQQSLGPPISRFTASDVVTLLWALVKLRAHLPRSAWPPLLQAAAAGPSSLSPRDTSLLGWSLVKLAAPMPAGWFQQLLDAQAAVLPSYPRRSLVLLMYAAARLRCRLPSASIAPVLAALQQQLAGMSSRDLAMMVWSLSPLAIRPPQAFMAAALAASKRQLSCASCEELVALLMGVGRLAYLPPGPWLLELYDQLYWTADQLSLRQLCRVAWALGALRLVAVPKELTERLLAFTQHALRLELPASTGAADAAGAGGAQAAAAAAAAVQAMSAAAGEQQPAQSGHAEAAAASPAASDCRVSSSSSSSSSKQLRDASKLQYAVAKQLTWLLQGLAGLRQQLSPSQRNTAGTSWLMAVTAADGPGSHVLLPTYLHACALLGVMPPRHCCAAVLLRLGQLRGKMSHGGLALGLWGAVRLGCRPDKDWLAVWLGDSERLLGIAGAGEINMLLDACGRLGHVPRRAWLDGATERLGQQVARMSAGSMAETLRCLLVLDKAAAAAAAVAPGPVPAAVAPGAPGGQAGPHPPSGVLVAVPARLLSHMCARADELEGQRASPFAVQRFQQRAALITAMLQQQQQQQQQHATYGAT